MEQPEEQYATCSVRLAHAAVPARRNESAGGKILRKTSYVLWIRRHAFAWWTEPYCPASFLTEAALSLACGAPVVISDGGSFPETGGGAANLFPVGNAKVYRDLAA
jgi:hypothetical protein